MKNTVLNFIGKKMIILSLLITGLFICSQSSVQGQSATYDQLFAVPQGNFVDVPTAIERLESELDLMRVTLSLLNPNFLAYKEMNAKYAYYDQILAILLDGKEVDSNATAKAIPGGFRIFGSEAFSDITKTQKLNFKQSATDLLSE